MPKPTGRDRGRHPRAGSPPRRPRATRPADSLARPAAPPRLLDRLLETPNLAQVVPRLQPEMLHRVIERCGLEDCAEIVALATPTQLMRIFDVDLWHSDRPGADAQLDADRFGLWLEVLLESGAAVAAQKLAGMDVGLVVAALAQHVRVFDRAAVSAFTTLDGDEVPDARRASDAASCEIGGYLVEARRARSWDAIVELLIALADGHGEEFDRVMGGCRDASNAGFERDGLDDLMAGAEQQMFDVAIDRERRRERSGYVTPAQAAAFLRAARQIHLQRDAPPPASPLARAYFRSASADTDADEAGVGDRRLLSAADAEPAPGIDPHQPDASDAEVAAVVDVLIEAGVVAPPPRALLEARRDEVRHLAHIRAHLQTARERSEELYAAKTGELAYLANTLVAGGSIQARAFTEREASDAALAICNLALENWPRHWDGEHDLVTVFQVGWTILHDEVCMDAAERLIGVLTDLRCADEAIQGGLNALRRDLMKAWRAGTPWRARESLDVLVSLDMPAWATMLGLLDECPFIHGAMRATAGSHAHTVDASAFELISENRQIDEIRRFLASLPDALRG